MALSMGLQAIEHRDPVGLPVEPAPVPGDGKLAGGNPNVRSLPDDPHPS